ncbi:hypothetical protein LCGC14_2957570, partial [marine sediment metagenome]
MASRYWLGTTSTDHAVAANWAASSGGAPGASVPGTGDDATLDGNGNNACTLTANLALANLITLAGYTAKLDLATFNLTMDDGGNITLDQGGEFDCGAGTLSMTNGTFDFEHVGTLTRGSAAWVFNQVCSIVSTASQNCPHTTVAAGGTLTLLASGGIFSARGMTINGTLNIEAGRFVYAWGSSAVILNTGGQITGTGTFILYIPLAGNGLT